MSGAAEGGTVDSEVPWDTEVAGVPGLGAVEAATDVTGLGVAAGGRS